MTGKTNDVAAGLICMAVGGAFAAYTLTYLRLGTISRMGSGYFPLVLSCALMLIGAAMAVRALGRPCGPVGPFSWRGLVLLTAAPVAFALSLERLGFLAATALLVLISSFASARMPGSVALVLSAGMTALCLLLFYYGLGLSVRPLPAWLFQ